MKRITTMMVAAAAAVAFTGSAFADKIINGAGASFPAPVYRVWTYKYHQSSKVRVNYQSVGSGAGIAQIKAGTVDFGASDKPLTLEEQQKSKLVQFPMLMGGVVVVANIPGISPNDLQLTSDILADIFLGKISKWSDKRIRDLNNGITLPDMPITVVHRSDGSGTTWIFTNYLSKISDAWRKGPGCAKAVRWPCGLGGQKNPGVANAIKKTMGSIGYLEYTYALEADLPTIMLRNRAGNFVKANMENFQAAGANADWDHSPGMYMVLTNQPGAKSWPITGVTYILTRTDTSREKMQDMVRYFNYCYKEGANCAKQMHYVPIPANVVEKVKELWKKAYGI